MDYHLTASLLDSLGIAMCVFDRENRTTLWNPCFLRFFPEHAGHVYAGEPYTANLRRFYQERLAPEELPHIERYISDGIARHQAQSRPFVFLHRGRWLRVVAQPQPNGDRVRVWFDLSSAEAALQLAEPPPSKPVSAPAPDALRMFEHVGEGVSVHDAEGRIVFANDRFVSLYGLPAKEAALGRRYDELAQQCWAAASPQERDARAEDTHAALHDGMHFAGVPFFMPWPGNLWVRVAMNRTTDGHTYATHTDVSTDKQVEGELRALTDQLRQESAQDALTGLQNRRGLEILAQELVHQPGPHGLLFIDLDGFKAVNDSAGHGAGDSVLSQVAARLRASVRASDTVVRLGGDEFVVLLSTCNTQQALAVAHKIVQAICSTSFSAAAQTFQIGASVGVRIFSGDADSPDVVLHDADAACYRAKRNGRGRVEVFGEEG